MIDPSQEEILHIIVFKKKCMTEAMDYGTGKQMTTIGHSEIEISKLWLT
jgi:hypothetical protein